MVKNQLKTLMLWVIAVVVLLQTAQCHVFKTVWSENKQTIMHQKEKMQPLLSAAEIDRFMLLWPQYKEMNLQALPSQSLSVDNKQIVDWKTKVWFVYHRQDVERFFYIRQRLADLLRQIAIKRNAEAVIKQMLGRQDELSHDMVEQHKRRVKSLQLNDEEVAIISKREDDLKQLFRLYP